MDTDRSEADIVHVHGCNHKLEFDAAASTATNRRILILEGLQTASGKGKFQPDNRNGCEKYSYGDDNEWFLRCKEKGNNVYMKYCKVLLETEMREIVQSLIKDMLCNRTVDLTRY